MPSGRTPQAQMDCGFQGIRLQTAAAVREPELLDIVGKAGGTPYIEGNEAYRVAADPRVSYAARTSQARPTRRFFPGTPLWRASSDTGGSW